MHMSRGVHGTGRARQCRHEHASAHEMHARVCMVRAVRAGACTSCSHFDALQRRHVRRSWSTAAYFESSRVYRHVILSKELQTLPWGLESTPRSRWHPLGGVCRIPDPCLELFHLYGICKPFLHSVFYVRILVSNFLNVQVSKFENKQLRHVSSKPRGLRTPSFWTPLLFRLVSKRFRSCDGR